MRFGSLFAGVGGFDLGFERAGMQCEWQVEIDKYCNQVLEKHWKDVRRFEDVNNVGEHNLLPVELICGGFPCQDLSVAGKRAGLDGDRSSLWYEFERIIGEMLPAWVVIENVPGLLNSNDGQDFAVILNALDNFGYGVAWRVLDSQYFGVPQRRRRVFIVGSFGSLRAGQVLFESKSLSGRAQESGTDRQGAPEGALRDLEKDGRDRVSTYWDGGQLSDTLDTSMLVKGQMMPEKRRMPAVISKSVGHSGGKTLKFNKNVNTLNAQSGSETTAMFNGVWQMHHTKEVYREGDETVAPTLQERMGTGGNNVTMIGVRRLTPTECCRLQGFPDDWNALVSDTQRYKQMGNAVTVNVVEWLGRRIMAVENSRKG